MILFLDLGTGVSPRPQLVLRIVTLAQVLLESQQRARQRPSEGQFQKPTADGAVDPQSWARGGLTASGLWGSWPQDVWLSTLAGLGVPSPQSPRPDSGHTLWGPSPVLGKGPGGRHR